MSSRTLLASTLALAGIQCFGATPLATISSSQSIVVSGIAVPTNRVMSWPVSLNDEIVTQTAPAVVRFTDGTVVTLQRNSRMRLDPGPSGVQVKMLSGSAIYDIKARSAVSIAPAVDKAAAATTPVLPKANAVQAASARQAQASALAYKMPEATSAGSGVVYAPAAISSGVFMAAAARDAVTEPGSGTRIELPNGTILEVTSTQNGGYIINKVDVPVYSPDGTKIYVTPSTSPLVGATIVPPQAGSPSTATVTLPGQTAPLSPTDLATQLSNAATAAYTESVAQLPPGTPAPSFSPVTTGTFTPNPGGVSATAP